MVEVVGEPAPHTFEDMTTRMAIPDVRFHGSYPDRLDERIAYGNLPRWIVQGVDVPGVNIPQANYAKQLNQLPPLYAGHSTGVIKHSYGARPDPKVKAYTIQMPIPAAGANGYTSYVSKKSPRIALSDSPYVYSASHLGTQPKRSWKFNMYNQHAKQGFKFWLEEKKPFSQSQKYTFGSTKTFHGLGNAPRN